MKPDTKSILKGMGIAVGLEAAGAVVGAVTNTSCDAPTAGFLCGPTSGALLGGMSAGAVSQAVGLGLAVFSPKRRLAGIGMAAGPVVLSLVQSALLSFKAASINKTTVLGAPANQVPSAGGLPTANAAVPNVAVASGAAATSAGAGV